MNIYNNNIFKNNINYNKIIIKYKIKLTSDY